MSPKKKPQTNSLKTWGACANISIFTDLEIFCVSRDLSLANIKDFQTCSLEDLDEILK